MTIALDGLSLFVGAAGGVVLAWVCGLLSDGDEES